MTDPQIRRDYNADEAYWNGSAAQARDPYASRLSCPPCNQICEQGDTCPARQKELPIVMADDTFFDTIDLLIVSARYIVLGIAALVAGLAVYSLVSA